jgi:hypothetical protein
VFRLFLVVLRWGIRLGIVWLTLSFVGDDLREPPTFHDEMEKRLKMDF